METRRQVIRVLATLAVAGLATVAWTFMAWLPPEDTRVARAIGREMARETLRLHRPPGRIVVLARDTSEFRQPSVDAALAAFASELDAGRAKADVVRRLAVDPLRQVQVPAGDFLDLLRRGRDGDVIVSFMGPPLLGPEALVAIGRPRAKVVAFCPGYLPRYLDLRMLAERGLVHGGVVARAEPSGETFEGQYQPWSLALAGGTP